MSDYIVEAAQNTGHIFENTLKSFGIVDAAASGNKIGAGVVTYAEARGLTEAIDASSTVKVIGKLIPGAGAALVAFSVELAKDPNHDGYRACCNLGRQYRSYRA